MFLSVLRREPPSYVRSLHDVIRKISNGLWSLNVELLNFELSARPLNGAQRLNPSIGLRAGYLERLERDPFLVSIRDHTFREGLKKGIRKILTGTSVSLDTCLLMATRGRQSYSTALSGRSNHQARCLKQS